jgi:hypothetical protein
METLELGLGDGVRFPIPYSLKVFIHSRHQAELYYYP